MYRQNSRWNRQELYEKVWQLPLRKLAVEYGISDVGLAKVCRKLEIPLPGLGHWTKIACGHTIARPPLPVMENIPVLIRQIREPETCVVQKSASPFLGSDVGSYVITVSAHRSAPFGMKALCP